MPRSINSPASLILVAGLLASAASAADRHWNNPSGGLWTNQNNWLETTFPGPTDDAFFDLAATYTVTFGANAACRSVTVGAGAVTFSLGTNSLFLSDSLYMGDIPGQTPALILSNGAVNCTNRVSTGFSAPSTLTVQSNAALSATAGMDLGVSANSTFNCNGTVSCGEATMGQTSAAPSTATVSGSSALWTMPGLFRVGFAGSATLNIISAGRVSAGLVTIGGVDSSTSVANILGANSRLDSSGELIAGDFGTGTLAVSNAGRAVTGQGTLGVAPAGMGFANISGANSRWELSGAFQASRQGQSTTTITSGGVLTSTAPGFLSVFSGSSAAMTVNGSGSSASFNGQFQVGREGSATVNIENGGNITSSSLGSASNTAGLLGLQNAGDGAVTVSGSGSSWTANSGSIVVGWSARGTLNILNASTVTSVGGFVARNPNSIGILNIVGAGSRWNSSSSVRIRLDQNDAPGGTGTATVSSGGVLQATSLSLGPQGTLAGNGTVQAPVTNGGVVSPGSSAGTLTIQGAYTQSAAGRLVIEIGGATPGSGHDVLSISGAASLNGTLSVSAINNFNPSTGATFTILTAGSRSGTFSAVSSATLPGGRRFTASYTPTSVILTVAAGCQGDANGDNMVNFIDLNIVLSNFGMTGTGLAGDLDGDGDVDFVDLNIVLSFFGTNC